MELTPLPDALEIKVIFNEVVDSAQSCWNPHYRLAEIELEYKISIIPVSMQSKEISLIDRGSWPNLKKSIMTSVEKALEKHWKEGRKDAAN